MSPNKSSFSGNHNVWIPVGRSNWKLSSFCPPQALLKNNWYTKNCTQLMHTIAWVWTYVYAHFTIITIKVIQMYSSHSNNFLVSLWLCVCVLRMQYEINPLNTFLSIQYLLSADYIVHHISGTFSSCITNLYPLEQLPINLCLHFLVTNILLSTFIHLTILDPS